MANYKQGVENYEKKTGKQFMASDKKKLLAQPFFLEKYTELPEPKKGQKEWDLFQDIYGEPWDKYAHVNYDPEEKITEFNYEKFIPKVILDTKDVTSDEFKKEIKLRNLKMKTKMEQHIENQNKFKELMPVLVDLTAQEQKDLIHLLNSKNKMSTGHKQRTLDLLDDACDDKEKARLAKLSEEENFRMKNTYLFNKQTMRYADRSKMPIDESKVRDILKNEHLFRRKIVHDINNYHDDQHANQFEQGLMLFANEVAYGEMRDLLRDVGINKYTLRFNNSEMVDDAIQGKKIYENDDQIQYLQKGRYNFIDRTDYEDDFPHINEWGHPIPFGSMQHVNSLFTEPMVNKVTEEDDDPEEWPQIYPTGEYKEINQEQQEDDEFMDELYAGEDSDMGVGVLPQPTEDYDEDPDGEEEPEFEYDEEEDYGAEVDDGTEDISPPDFEAEDDLPEFSELSSEEQRILGDDNNQKSIRKSYNDMELDTFMKLLNIKPHTQWNEDNVYHYKIGTKTYEDDA